MRMTMGRGFVVGLLIAAGCSSTNNAGPGTGGSAGTSTGGTATGGTTAAGGSAGAAAGAGGHAGTTGVAGNPGGGISGGGTGGTAGAGGTGGAVAWLTPPAGLPPTLAVPVGATLKVHDRGVGAQVYTCTASTGAGGAAGAGGTAGSGSTTYAWVLKAPDAMLLDQNGVQVGTHGAGPEWTSTDGSIVNGSKIFQENSPLSDAIPWLLLRATSTTGTGVFSDITYVQRANTTGGKAPATGCDGTTVGTDTRVSYTADYYFYSGGGVANWLDAPAGVPGGLAVPAGNVLALHDHAIGAQVYTCTVSGGADAGADAGAPTYAWVLKAPDAVLYDATFNQVGTHGMGPNWTSTVDGSVVNGMKVAQADAPISTAIPWLLLKAMSTTGTGVFTKVTYVQRLNTNGGKAPASGCDATTAGTDTRVPYSADYEFFTATPGDGGTAG